MTSALSNNLHVPASGNIAAFFDLDGTLLPLPSLERRFVAALRNAHAIPLRNYVRWLIQALRLAPHGITAVTHANKMYLRNISASQNFLSSTDTLVYAEPRRVCVPRNQGAAASAGASLDLVPAFFPDAINRISWHIAQGHSIVLVTGTLAPLAGEAARILKLCLAAHGITTSIAICATRLEHSNSRWTGRITGEAIFGQAKARAIQRIAARNGFGLSHSYAYGDSTADRWMLGAVGRPSVVNPSRELQRIARLRNWPILLWKQADSHQSTALTSTKPLGIDCKMMPDINSETLG